MEASKFRVVIVGGSVAGLVLAHSLHRAGIDHIVLEKHNDIAPELGASIGIMPNDSQVLDQLGLYEKVEKCIEPVMKMHMTFPDGFSVTSELGKVLQKRYVFADQRRYGPMTDDCVPSFGYGIAFLSRRDLLEILYESYPEKTRVLTGRKVVDVKRCPDRICALTDDGVVHEGSVIVGTDGVHSRIRSEIWRAAEEDMPGAISNKEKKCMTVEYACAFGISSGLPSIKLGAIVNGFLDGSGIGIIPGKDGRSFWFVATKLDQKYVYPDVPRFSIDDAEKPCREMKDVRFYEDLRVGDLWRTRESASMTALEEGLFKTWFHDRMVLVGDSVHKMTPNSGQDRNCAIEDAAALASLLHKLARENSSRQPSREQIQDTLQSYQNIRYRRIRRIYYVSWIFCRTHALQGLLCRLVARYVTPWNQDLQGNIAANMIANGETLDFLPLVAHPGSDAAKDRPKARTELWPYRVVVFLAALVTQGFMWCFNIARAV